ncbi:MAG: cryptochrome/photolyase family protein [Phycisphaerales bacterium]
MAQKAHATAPTQARAWVFVAPDQLHRTLGAMRGADPGSHGVVLVESREWLSRRPYHRMRVAAILLAQRSFAAECAQEGFEVRTLQGEAPMVQQLGEFAAQHGPLASTEWAEREMRSEFKPLVAEGVLRTVSHDGWLTHREDFAGCRRGKQWSMDSFYRAYRTRTGLLMDDAGEPIGGRLSFDTENRKSWSGKPAAPEPPRFEMTALRREVQREIESRFAQHPGELDLAAIPASLTECESLWTWAKQACLPHFGPFEDAMSLSSRGIFHTRMSPLMNLQRVEARRMVQDVLSMDLPIESKEGFIRQIVGWREFVRWVHLETDGFRDAWPSATSAGDGGFARWSGHVWKPAGATPRGVDGGARPRALGSEAPVPPAFWGAPSGLRCLDEVVASVWREGWSHHITRLMVLGNLATLLDVDARDLADWFWIAYMDAWDWVVEPNVMAMATYGAGGVMTTKPYVAGAAYIDRMSDYCSGCAFTPGGDCPVTPLYWAFLERHEPQLKSNPRLKLPLASMRKRPAERRDHDQRTFVHVREVLANGKPLVPADFLPLG